MRQTEKRKQLKGMTLVEVIIAMVVIVLVTAIAYMGVSTSAGLVQRGIDIRNADGRASDDLEPLISAYQAQGGAPEQTRLIAYNLTIDKAVTDGEGNCVTVAAGAEEYPGSVAVKEIGITEVYDDNMAIDYNIVIPYVSEVPSGEGG